MRVRATALALAVAAMVGSAGCAPAGYDQAVRQQPSLAPDGTILDSAAALPELAVPAGSPAPPGSAVPAGEAAVSPSPQPSVAPPAGERAGSAASTSTPEPGPPSQLSFTTRTVDGAAFTGETLIGKPTVLWFWVPGCPSCIAQVPDVLDTDRQFDGRVNVVSVAGVDRAAPIRKFVTDRRLDAVTNLFDTTGAIWKRFGITRQGMYVLLDATGRVRYAGAVARGELAKQIALVGVAPAQR